MEAEKRRIDVDWSNLPGEILEQILRRLRHAKEVIRFGAVCKSWQSVATEARFRLVIPLCPFLQLYSDELDNHDEKQTVIRFLDLSDNKLLDPIKRAFPIDNLITSVTRGWLGIIRFYDIGHSEQYLLNPLSGLRIELTPLQFPVHGLVLSSSPLNPSCIAVAWGSFCIYICRISDKRWKSVFFSDSDRIRSIKYCKNNFYAINIKGDVLLIESCPDQPRVKLILPSPTVDNNFRVVRFVHVVESDGDLLQIIFKIDDVSTFYEVLKLNCNTWAWDKTTNLGDNAILLDEIQCTSISAVGSPVFRPNCIYAHPFIDSEKKLRTSEFDLRTGKFLKRTILKIPRELVPNFAASCFTPDISSVHCITRG